MPAIPWSEFTKEELVEILNELEQCQYLVQPLWMESDVYLLSESNDSPIEARLPPRVLELRDVAAQRMRKREQRRESPLRRLLENPFRRRREVNRKTGS